MFLPADLDFNDEQGFQQTIVQNLGIGAKNGGWSQTWGYIYIMGYGVGRYNQHQPAISNNFVQNQVLKLWVKSWEALMAGDFQDLNRSEIMHNCGTTHFDLGPKNGRPWVYLKIQWKPTKFWCWITVFLIRVNIFMGIPHFRHSHRQWKIAEKLTQVTAVPGGHCLEGLKQPSHEGPPVVTIVSIPVGPWRLDGGGTPSH